MTGGLQIANLLWPPKQHTTLDDTVRHENTSLGRCYDISTQSLDTTGKLQGISGHFGPCQCVLVFNRPNDVTSCPIMFNSVH